MKLMKKIAPFAASLLMLGATAAAADLATWKSSFPGADTAIVVGAASTVDTIGAVDLTAALTVTSTSSGTASTAGDTYLIRGTGSKVYLEGAFKEILDDGNLQLLKDGNFRDSYGDNDNDVDYTQFLTIDPDSSLFAKYQANTDDSDNEADMYVKLAEGDQVYSYELNFKKAVKVDVADADKDMKTTELTMMGKTYTFSKIEVDTSNETSKMTLLTGAIVANTKDETPLEFTIEGKTYKITPSIYADDSVQLTAETSAGTETTGKLAEGSTYKLKDGTKVGIKDVFYSSKESKMSTATLYMGANEIELEEGGEIIVDGEEIENSLVTFGQSSDGTTISLTSIKIDVAAQENAWLNKDAKWVDPALGAVELKFAGLKEDTTVNVVELTGASTTGKIKFVNSVGDNIELPLFQDGTNARIGKVNTTATQGGYGGAFLTDGEVLVVTNADTVYTDDHYFLVSRDTDGTAVHKFYIDSITVNGTAITKVKIKDDTAGTSEEVTATGPTSLFGNYNVGVTINPLNVSIASSTGDVFSSADVLKLKDGAKMSITYTSDINPTINITEDGTTTYGVGFTAVYKGSTTKDEIVVEQSSIKPSLIEKDDDSKSYTGYSLWGAKVEWNSDNYDVKVTSPEDRTEVLAYLLAPGATVTYIGDTGSGIAPIAVMDDQIDNVKTKNIIAIGGSAINKVAAELLGISYPTYGSDSAWTAATGVDGAGKAVVKLMNSPYTTGKYAMLVAGWEGTDTTRAAKALREGTPALAGMSTTLNTATSTVTVLSS